MWQGKLTRSASIYTKSGKQGTRILQFPQLPMAINSCAVSQFPLICTVEQSRVHEVARWKEANRGFKPGEVASRKKKSVAEAYSKAEWRLEREENFVCSILASADEEF